MVPQNAEREKTEVTFGGPWVPMCVFLTEKRTSPKWPFGRPGCSRRGIRAPRWPIWPLFEILGGPWDLPFRPLGRPGTPPSPRKKIKNDFWGRLGGANLRISRVRMHSAKKQKMNKKSMCAKSCSAIVFGGLQNRLFGRPEGPKSPFQKFISEKRGLKISEL